MAKTPLEKLMRTFYPAGMDATADQHCPKSSWQTFVRPEGFEPPTS